MTTAAHCGEAAVWMIGRRCRPRASWLRRRIYLFIEGNVCSLVGVVLVNGRPSAYACCFDNLRGCSASESRDWALPAPTSIYNTARFAAFNYPKPINSQFVYYLLTLSFKSQKKQRERAVSDAKIERGCVSDCYKCCKKHKSRDFATFLPYFCNIITISPHSLPKNMTKEVDPLWLFLVMAYTILHRHRWFRRVGHCHWQAHRVCIHPHSAAQWAGLARRAATSD